MSRTTVTSPDGTRWTVRTRRTRVPECFLAAPPGTGDALDVLLDGVLRGLPLPAGHPAVALGDTRADRDHPGLPALASLTLASWHLAELVAEWRRTRRPDARGRTWVVTLEARGRTRRGASWLLDPGADGDTVERACGEVAAAVFAGGRPEPRSATLLDAWDRRPNHPGVYC